MGKYEWGERLRFHRKMAGLSQAELAEKIGMHPRTISDWETGKRGMMMESAEKVFGCFGQTIVLRKDF